jgi:DNA-binding transcriptional ArsR family regulator
MTGSLAAPRPGPLGKELPRMSEVGRTIYRIVKEQPGIHFRGLGRAAGLSSAGQLRHHLDRLERQGLVVELEDGRYKRFFVAGDHDRTLRPGLARFARSVPRKIGKLLLVHPMNRTELRRSLGCADSTLGYHLKRMIEQGDLEKQRGRNCCRYSLTSPELVQKVLMLQGAGLEPEARSEEMGTPLPATPNLARPEPRPVREVEPLEPLPAEMGKPAPEVVPKFLVPATPEPDSDSGEDPGEPVPPLDPETPPEPEPPMPAAAAPEATPESLQKVQEP